MGSTTHNTGIVLPIKQYLYSTIGINLFFLFEFFWKRRIPVPKCRLPWHCYLNRDTSARQMPKTVSKGLNANSGTIYWIFLCDRKKIEDSGVPRDQYGAWRRAAHERLFPLVSLLCRPHLNNCLTRPASYCIQFHRKRSHQLRGMLMCSQSKKSRSDCFSYRTENIGSWRIQLVVYTCVEVSNRCVHFVIVSCTIVDRKNAPPPATPWTSVSCGCLP